MGYIGIREKENGSYHLEFRGFNVGTDRMGYVRDLGLGISSWTCTVDSKYELLKLGKPTGTLGVHEDYKKSIGLPLKDCVV